MIADSKNDVYSSEEDWGFFIIIDKEFSTDKMQTYTKVCKKDEESQEEIQEYYCCSPKIQQHSSKKNSKNNMKKRFLECIVQYGATSIITCSLTYFIFFLI
jgi:23S rRNA A2030 N6-methylase RlmJ